MSSFIGSQKNFPIHIVESLLGLEQFIRESSQTSPLRDKAAAQLEILKNYLALPVGKKMSSELENSMSECDGISPTSPLKSSSGSESAIYSPPTSPILAHDGQPVTDVTSRLWNIPESCRTCVSCNANERCLEHGFLGGGSFGKVYLGRPKSQLASKMDEVAMKVCLKKCSKGMNRLTDLLREVSIMQYVTAHIQSDSILTLVDVYYDVDSITFVVPKLGEDVFSRIFRRKQFSEIDAANIIRQLLLAVKALHAHGICHLDIKLENLAYVSDDSDTIVLIDLGFAVQSETWPRRIGKVPFGTPAYLSPEILSDCLYSPAADVWAIGVTMYTLLVGSYPYKTVNDTRMMRPDPIPSYMHLSHEGRDILGRMLGVADPFKRITIDNMLQHQWLSYSNRTNFSSNLVEDHYTLQARDRTLNKFLDTYGELSAADFDNIRTIFEEEAVHEDMGVSRTAPTMCNPGIYIDFGRFQTVMRRMGLPALADEHIFSLFDVNGNNMVDYREFIMAITSLRGRGVLQHRFIFMLFDADQNGTIELEEFEHVFGNIIQSKLQVTAQGSTEGLGLEEGEGVEQPSPEQIILAEKAYIASIFAKIDVDSSGTITFEEFSTWYATDAASVLLNDKIILPFVEATQSPISSKKATAMHA